jgi:hypothetical protein
MIPKLSFQTLKVTACIFSDTVMADNPSRAIMYKVMPLQAGLWPRGGRGIALLFQDLGDKRG